MANRIAVIETNKGTIKIELLETDAQKTTENFRLLAEKNYYNDIIFHRVIKNFMVQGGDPVGEGYGGESAWGILVFLGISRDDTEADAIYLVNKTLNLRIFEDSEGKMDRSLIDIDGGLLVVSQFTLYGDVRKGRRPSFIKAALPVKANELYRFFVNEAEKQIKNVAEGKFQAMMNVELVNDGPVTILLDSDHFGGNV